MTILALGLVARLGIRMPFADEWRWLPVVVGDQPVNAEWVFGFVNEHRFILPKLVYIVLIRLTGADFRAGGFFSVAVLSATAAMLLVVVRRRRGAARLADAFFPLALLHWAQVDNLIWGFQLHFPMSIGLVLAALVLVFGLRGQPSVRTNLAIAGCLLAAALSGPFGQAFLPPFACWLGYSAWIQFRSGGGSRRATVVSVALAAALLATIPLLRIGHSMSSGDMFPGEISPANLTITARLKVAVEFLANGFGPAAKLLWPVSGLLVIAACVASAWQLGVVLGRQPGERLRAAGLLAGLAGMAAVALVIGWSRAFLGPQAGFETRYITLLIPLVCLFYLQCQAFAGRRAAVFQNALCILMCVLAVFNGFKGLRTAADRETQFAMLRADAQAGMPVADLALRYTEENFILVTPREFAGWLEMLRVRGWYPFDPVAPRRDNTLAIRPMIEVAPAYEAPGRIRVPGGERFVQRFTIPQAGRLWRMDLQLGKWRWRRSADEFRWELRDAANPSSAPLAAGLFDYRHQCAHYRWATLTLAPVALEHGRELELVLQIPAGRRSCLEIPLYNQVTPGSLDETAGRRGCGDLRSEDKSARTVNASSAEIGKMQAMLFLRSPGQPAGALSPSNERLFH
jgi:hypothetical protein